VPAKEAIAHLQERAVTAFGRLRHRIIKSNPLLGEKGLA